MRKFFWLAILALWCAQAFGQITEPHNYAITNGATPNSTTLGSAVGTPNHTIIVIVRDSTFTPGPASLTVADNNTPSSNTYSSSTLQCTTDQCVQVFCVYNPSFSTNPPTITITDANTSNHTTGSIREYVGLAGCAIDAQAGATVTSTTAQTTNSITTTATDLLVEAFEDGGSGSYSAVTGWTNSNFDGNNPSVDADQLNVAAGSHSGNATRTIADTTWIGTIVSYKSASAGSAGIVIGPKTVIGKGTVIF